MKIRKNSKKYRQFTKERELYKLMQTPIKEHEKEMKLYDEAVKRLAHAVVEKALSDLFFGDSRFSGKTQKHLRLVSQLSALEFLTSPDLQYWADLADMELDVNELLKSPMRAKRVLEYVKGVSNERPENY